MYVVERAELWLVCSCFAKWGAGKLRTEAESLTIDSFWTVLIRAYFAPFHLRVVVTYPASRSVCYFCFRPFLFLDGDAVADSEGQLSTTVCESTGFSSAPSLGTHEAEYYGPRNSVLGILLPRGRPRQASTHKGKHHLNSQVQKGRPGSRSAVALATSHKGGDG